MLFFPKPSQNNFRWNADADGKAVPNPRPIGNVQLHITHRVQPGDESLVKTRHQPVHAGNHASVRMAGHLKIHAVRSRFPGQPRLVGNKDAHSLSGASFNALLISGSSFP